MSTGTKYRIRRTDAAGVSVWLMPNLDGQNSTDELVDMPPGPGRYTYQLVVSHYDSGGFSGDVVNFAYLTALVFKR